MLQMRSTGKLFYASLFAIGTLFAQGPPAGGGPGPEGRGFGGPGGGLGGPTVTGAPYSATRTETRQETLTDGNHIDETHTAKIYRDAEGRTRLESTMKEPSGTTRTVITIMDPVAGFVAHLNPADTSAMKQTLPSNPDGAMKPPHQAAADGTGPQMVKTDLGTNTIAGLAATGTRITFTIPAGTMGNEKAIVQTREVWTSTVLKIPVQVTSTDPQRGNSTMVLSDISQTAPDPSLFVIPSGYTVKDGPTRFGHGGPGGPGAGGPPPPDGGGL